MITVKDIEKTIKDAAKMKLEVTVRDISYVLLYFKYSVKDIAYKSIFDKDADSEIIEKYDKSKVVTFLKTYIESNFNEKRKEEPKKISVETLEREISKEENKAAIIALIDEIKQAESDGLIEKKDSIKMQGDLRNKLDKTLDSSEDDNTKFIIVNKKFNFICPHLQKECYIYTKEDLMEEYGLVEKNKD